MDAIDRSELIRVALGNSAADLVIKNGTLINVYTGELQPGTDIAVKGERIAWVGSDAGPRIGPGTLVIDAQGKFISPGFVDAHNHIDGWFTVSEYLRFALPGGTTTTVSDTSIISNGLGYEGVLAFLENSRRHPANIFATAQPMAPHCPPFETSAGPTEEELESILDEPGVIGLGETYWARLVEEHPRCINLVGCAQARGKSIEGHASGAKGDRLIACAAGGMNSCHEPMSVEEALERLRAGMCTMIRHGVTRSDLEAIAPIVDMGIDTRRLVLVSDGIWPDELVSTGAMNAVIRKAIDVGIDPVTAIQMATLNPAEHFGLDRDLGGIAPGKLADIVILRDLRTIDCEYVVCRGRIVARDGNMSITLQKDHYPEAMNHTMKIEANLTAEDFRIAVTSSNGRVRARAIAPLSSIVVGETQVEVPVVDGWLQSCPDEDVIKVALFNRTMENGPRFVGLLKGYGMKTGALGTTGTWDCYQLLVVGADEEDMARVANRLIETNGGAVVFDRGEKIAELQFPIGGIISELPMEEIAVGFRSIQDAARSLGITHPNPLLSLQTLTFTTVPFVRITESGMLDVRNKRILDLVVSNPS